MDFRQLQTFVAVAEHGTVSKASVRLGIAQPALSRQIKNLELDLRVRLFDRVRRRLLLTTDGEQLLADCRDILAAIGALKERAQLLQRRDIGVLKVAATPQTIDGVLARFLSGYAARRPNVEVRLSEAFGAALPAMLEAGDVNVVVTTAGAFEARQHPFEITWLPSLEFVAVCSPKLRLGNGGSLDVRGLGGYPLLLMDASFAVRAAFDAACRVAEFKPRVKFESRTPHTLLALAEAGHGVAIVPSVLPTHRYDLRIVRLTYRGKPLREGYAILRDKRRSLPAAAADFCESLVTYVRGVFPISRPSPAKSASVRKRARARKAAG